MSTPTLHMGRGRQHDEKAETYSNMKLTRNVVLTVLYADLETMDVLPTTEMQSEGHYQALHRYWVPTQMWLHFLLNTHRFVLLSRSL